VSAAQNFAQDASQAFDPITGKFSVLALFDEGRRAEYASQRNSLEELLGRRSLVQSPIDKAKGMIDGAKDMFGGAGDGSVPDVQGSGATPGKSQGAPLMGIIGKLLGMG
jgi:hypothetical protein